MGRKWRSILEVIKSVFICHPEVPVSMERLKNQKGLWRIKLPCIREPMRCVGALTSHADRTVSESLLDYPLAGDLGRGPSLL